MEIQPITQSDIPDCARLLMQSYNQPPWRYHWEQGKAEKYLSEYADVRQFVGFSLFDGQERTGALFAHTKTWWTGDLLYIDELFVSPAKQRSGYGKALIEHAGNWGREHGFSIISLMTNKFMPAFTFYNKNNFSPAEHIVCLLKEA